MNRYSAYEMTQDQVKELPHEAQERIRSALTCYDRVFVEIENGQYHVSTGVCIRSHYAADHRSLGCVSAENIYTADERIENYVNSFHDYPFEYNGRRNYPDLKRMDDDRSLVAKLNSEGNIEIN